MSENSQNKFLSGKKKENGNYYFTLKTHIPIYMRKKLKYHNDKQNGCNKQCDKRIMWG